MMLTNMEKWQGRGPHDMKTFGTAIRLAVALLVFSFLMVGVSGSASQDDAALADEFLGEYARDANVALIKFFGSRKFLLDNPGMLTAIAQKDKNALVIIEHVFRRVLSYGPFEERKAAVDLLGDWCSKGMVQGIGFITRGEAAQLWGECLNSNGVPTYGKQRFLDSQMRYVSDHDLEMRSFALESLARLAYDRSEWDKYIPFILAHARTEKEALEGQVYHGDKTIEKIYWRLDWAERMALEAQNVGFMRLDSLVTDVDTIHFRELSFEEQLKATTQESKYQSLLLDTLCASRCTQGELKRYIETIVRPERASDGDRRPLPHTITDIANCLIEKLKEDDEESRKLNSWFLTYVTEQIATRAGEEYDYRVLANGVLAYVASRKEQNSMQAQNLLELRPLLYRGLIALAKRVPVTDNNDRSKGFSVLKEALLALEGFVPEYANTLTELMPTLDSWLTRNVTPQEQNAATLVRAFREKLETQSATRSPTEGGK